MIIFEKNGKKSEKVFTSNKFCDILDSVSMRPYARYRDICLTVFGSRGFHPPVALLWDSVLSNFM